jgi:hypothetical protein
LKTTVSAALALALTLAAASSARAQVQSFGVTAPTISAYVIDGQNNPTLNVVRGNTYTFNVSATGQGVAARRRQRPSRRTIRPF